jgi:hypothetical protein
VISKIFDAFEGGRLTTRDGNKVVELIHSPTLLKAGEKPLFGVVKAGTEAMPKYAFYAWNEDGSFLDAEEKRAVDLIAA